MKKYFWIILITSIVLSGCKKNKENKLIGSWKLLPQYAYDTANVKIFQFNAGNQLDVITNDTDIVSANYELVQEFNKFYVDINGYSVYEDAHYYIEKLNKEILILQSYSPFLRKEFEKAD